MKQFIYKINQYLLEYFPTIWNTRLVWMLLTALTLHLLFFIFGFFTLSNPEILQERYVKDIFFNNGTVFLTSIISILLLVGWLIYMFKNNAFKNYYPTSSLKLFGQFLCYLVIIFFSTTFFLSYNYGIKTFIAITYSEEQINKEIEVSNDVALFFSQNLSDYTIDKRRFPKPFYELFCETEEKFIKKDETHINFLDESFQFYSLKIKEVPLNKRRSYSNQDSTYQNLVFNKVKDSIELQYFKDSVVNVQPFIKTSKPSYYNASHTFFVSRNDTLNDSSYTYNYKNYSSYEYVNYNNRKEFSVRHQLRNQRNHELLERNDREEIETLIETFLTFSNYYKVPHNLSTSSWLELIYHPNNFEVKKFIRNKPKDDFLYTTPTEQTKFQKFYTDNLTDYYFDKNALSSVFENIEDIKATNPLMDTIHFFMWFSFFFTCIIYMFRITGLKPLIFSIISVGLLTLIIVLLTALIFYVVKGNDDLALYFISYFTFIIGTIILLIPIAFSQQINKLVVAVCVNISIIGFPLYVFLIIAIISMHQNDACRDVFISYSKCYTLLNSLEENWSYVLFSVGVVFIVLYSKIIKNWKSLPEG